MHPYFTRERFGPSQFLAGFLLLVFLAQAVWLVRSELHHEEGVQAEEVIRISEGLRQWHGAGIAGAPLPESVPSDEFHSVSGGYDRQHSPLLYLASAAPLLIVPHRLLSDNSVFWQWLVRLPFLACGVFLGASLWYVARRLCGNAGGLVALTLYSFSPSLLQASAVWHTEPEIFAAWSAFGSVFTSIAVAHTLYAPREVVLWNWRRILLLGVSLAIAIGSQFSMIVLVPVSLGFLLYVAPVRKKAGVAIWAAACLVASILLFAFYFFHPHAFAASMSRAEFWGATWRGFAVSGVYKEVAAQIARGCPAFVLALPFALASYAVWPRARYFGNTAPLLVAMLCLVLAMAHPDLAGSGFLLAAIPFLLVFVAGILADVMETRYRALTSAAVLGMMLAYIGWNLLSLLRVTSR